MAILENQPLIRVMVDSNVLVAAVSWPRWPYEVMEHAVRGDFRLVLSAYIVDEARERVHIRFPERAQRLEEVLSASNYDLVPDPSLEEIAANLSLMRDPEDVPIALAAIHADLDFFLTHDKDFTQGPEELHRRLTILLPAVFLRDYMGWSSAALETIRYRNWSDMK